MTMSYTETVTYSFTKKQYDEWLENYCEDRDYIDDDDIWESFRDTIITQGSSEACEDGNEDTRDEVLYDVKEKIDPDGKRAEMRELEEQLQRAYESVNKIKTAMEALQKEM